MSERHIHLVLDDGSTIDLRWPQGARKFTIEVDEGPAPGSAETANPAAVSPESPAVTPDTGSVLEQRADGSA